MKNIQNHPLFTDITAKEELAVQGGFNFLSRKPSIKFLNPWLSFIKKWA